MKIKIKLTPDQFVWLVRIIQDSHGQIDYRNKPLQFLNIGAFLQYGQKKVIDLKAMYKMIMPPKPKTFTIDINQFTAICYVFNELDRTDELDSYCIALYETIKQQVKDLAQC